MSSSTTKDIQSYDAIPTSSTWDQIYPLRANGRLVCRPGPVDETWTIQARVTGEMLEFNNRKGTPNRTANGPGGLFKLCRNDTARALIQSLFVREFTDVAVFVITATGLYVLFSLALCQDGDQIDESNGGNGDEPKSSKRSFISTEMNMLSGGLTNGDVLPSQDRRAQKPEPT
ncbi:hypothetical protein BJX76DRAFT_358988 [Aspergillus varians]